jgi:ribulose-phosphate 3-epimerase
MSWDRGAADSVVAPSIYAADLAHLGRQTEALLDAGARIFHFDIGDGHFIDEITMGPVVMRSIAEVVHRRGGMFDCHLMISQPLRHLEQIKAAGGDSITFHLEADDDPSATIDAAHDIGLRVGIAINPETAVKDVFRFADRIDVVLCMSIHPGLSGQVFMPSALARIEALRSGLPDSVLVEVDGGIHGDTIAAARVAGADILVSGSGVFWGDDPGDAFRRLRAAAEPFGTDSNPIPSEALMKENR